MICPYCDNEIAYGNTTCPACGAELSNALGEGKVVLHGYPEWYLVENKIVCSIEGKVVAEVGMESRSTKVPIEVPIAQDTVLEFKFKTMGWLAGSQSIRLQAGKVTHVFFSVNRLTGTIEARVTAK